jgi:hypothetical protein
MLSACAWLIGSTRAFGSTPAAMASGSRTDDDMLVNSQVHGIAGAYAPVLHLCRVEPSGMFTTYVDSGPRAGVARPVQLGDATHATGGPRPTLQLRLREHLSHASLSHTVVRVELATKLGDPMRDQRELIAEPAARLGYLAAEPVGAQ